MRHPRIDVLNARLESHLTTHAFPYLALIIYGLAVILIALWGFHDEWHHNSPDTNLRYYISIARAAGYTLNLNASLVILLAARLLTTSLRDTWLHRILPLDRAFPAFHILVAYAIAVALLIHVPFHLVWIIAYDGWEGGIWKHNHSFVTGVLLLIAFLVSFTTSLPYFRKNRFRLFYITHMAAALLFFPLLILHGNYRQVPYTYKWLTGPLILYLIDRLLRRLKISTHTLALSRAEIDPPSHGILALRLPRPFRFRAGQYAELRVAALGSEWHPFTIASAPHEEHAVFFIKALGDWTNRLHTICAANDDENDDQSRSDGLTVQMRGPYGAPAQHVAGYERVVLISGGVGSTPFASICKDLHHRNIKERHENTCARTKAPLMGMEGVEARIRRVLAENYDVDIDAADGDEAVEAQRLQYVADMLNLTARGPPEEAFSSGGASLIAKNTTGQPLDETGMLTADSDLTSSGGGGEGLYDIDLDDSSMALNMQKDQEYGNTLFGRVSDQDGSSTTLSRQRSVKGTRIRLARLYEKRSRFLAFLHTTRIMFFLLLTLLGRISLVTLVPILDLGKFSYDDSHIDRRWIIITDTLLGFVLGIFLFSTICLEMSYMGRRYFRRLWRVLDFIVLLPLNVSNNVIGILAWAKLDPVNPLVFLRYIFFLPIVFLLLANRMYHSIRSRTLLDDSESTCGCQCHVPVPDVDFIWTTPHDVHDQWLRDELGPLATGTELRLHRFVTREREEDLEGSEAFIKDNIGRPEWDEIFGGIADNVPSHGEVGVFFCGPHTMGKAVMKSLKKIEVFSNLRGAYLNTTRDDVLMDDLELQNRSDVRKLRGFGCNVRFAFREENFN